MKEVKDVLNMSNTAIKKLKKGELENAVIRLKSLYNDSVSNGDANSLGIQLKEATDEVHQLRKTNAKLKSLVDSLRDEIVVLHDKGRRKAATISELNFKIETLESKNLIERIFKL